MKILKLMSLMMITCGFSSCYYIFNINEPPPPSFEQIKGIRYAEIRREFDNGVAIDQNGFHLEPEWRIYFTGNDSVKIYSDRKNRYMPYRIFHSHKDLFQFARRWFRVKHLSKDSILLQAMEVHDRKIDEDASQVYMTLYSENYIRNKLHTTIEKLRSPTRNDSLYVRYRAIQANSNPDSAFAARVPVMFGSRSRILEVYKIKPDADPNLGEFSKFHEYINPAYSIRINNAYRDFKYSFYMTVGHQGKMQFKKFNFPMEAEFIERKTRVAKGIIDIYLKNLLNVTPGKTLGYPHASVVEVYIVGKRSTDSRSNE